MKSITTTTTINNQLENDKSNIQCQTTRMHARTHARARALWTSILQWTSLLELAKYCLAEKWMCLSCCFTFVVCIFHWHQVLFLSYFVSQKLRGKSSAKYFWKFLFLLTLISHAPLISPASQGRAAANSVPDDLLAGIHNKHRGRCANRGFCFTALLQP